MLSSIVEQEELFNSYKKYVKDTKDTYGAIKAFIFNNFHMHDFREFKDDYIYYNRLIIFCDFVNRGVI